MALAGMLLAGLSTMACNGVEPSGTLVGESEHFRLYVDPEVTVPAAFQGNNGLIALETNWSDTQTMLKMPEGKINYYWTTASRVEAECNTDLTLSGCELGETVISSVVPHQHELNHAYAELLVSRRLPFIAEGIAEAIGCGAPASAMVTKSVPWQNLVAATTASPQSDDLYQEGGLLARYLIRTQGIDAFVAYYRQAPTIRDPALFVDNFGRFWSTSLDDVWSAMHALGPGEYGEDQPVCPCSLPPIVVDGSEAPVAGPAATPYWTIPAEVDTIAFESSTSVTVSDCQGNQTDLTLGGQVVLARLGGNSPSYVLAPLDAATSANYVADTCAGTVPYLVPTDLVDGQLNIDLNLSTATSTDIYLQLQVSSAKSMSTQLRGTVGVCDSCAFADATCQLQPASQTIAVQGTFYVRIPLSDFAQDTAGTVSAVLFFN